MNFPDDFEEKIEAELAKQPADRATLDQIAELLDLQQRTLATLAQTSAAQNALLERLTTVLERLTAEPAPPQPDADGWIQHTGGPCPLPADAPVTVRFRDGKTAGYVSAGYWTAVHFGDSDWWNWSTNAEHRFVDIIAYRLHDKDETK